MTLSSRSASVQRADS